MARTRRAVTFLDIAAATPESRDRYVDFLRAVSIGVVVAGHWTLAVITWRGGEVGSANALDLVPGLWISTWLFMVMPVFFFVGGFSNYVTLASSRRKGEGYAQFLHGRARRLMRPTAVFLAVWIPLSVAADLATGISDATLGRVTLLLTRPLWFVGIYLIVIAFTPFMESLHRRHRVRVPLALAAGAAAVDAAALGAGLELAGYLNFALVWLFVHQAGFFYADGTLARLGKPRLIAAAVAAFAFLVATTASGVYSPSMVGLVGERSNSNPPTFALLALSVGQISLVMLVRGAVTRWLADVKVWAYVIAVNAFIMTVFLWHQTAILANVAAMYPMGFPQPEAGSGAWWALRPVWIATLGAWLILLVMIFGRFERVRRDEAEAEPPPGHPLGAAVGAGYLVAGILGFAVAGLDGFAAGDPDRLVIFDLNPLQALLHVVAGGFILKEAASGGAGPLKAAGALLALLGAGGLLVPALARLLAANAAVSAAHLATGALVLWGTRRNALARQSPSMR